MNFQIREAGIDDAEAIAGMTAHLGHMMTLAAVRRRLEQLPASDSPQLVASIDGKVIGLCGLHIMVPIHRPRPVGRITILQVAEEFRGQGIGRALVEEAEKRMAEAGCCLVELTSNERLVEAHAFYRHLGFGHTSKRFAKQL